MATLRVDVEWRKGATGLDGTYSFYPRPSLTRPGIVQKRVEFKIPLALGSTTQVLGSDSRIFILRGVLVFADGNFDTLDTKRRAFIAGIGTGIGQLHIISNLGNLDSKHIYYKGLPTKIDFDGQTNSKILDYTVEILLSDPTETIV